MSGRSHHGFHRRRRTVRLTLADQERELLADLLEQLVELLRPDPGSEPADPLAAMVGISPDARTPTDPALARLLPNAYEDPDAATEFRRFTEADLRATKIANASRARNCLQRPGTIELDQADTLAWLSALNDLRLVLGTRLEVTEDTRGEAANLPPDQRNMYLVYDWLTYHQDSLLNSLS